MISKKPSIAFFSPVNPVRSGISDYSELLLRQLRNKFDFYLFIESYQPESMMFNNGIPVTHYRNFEWMNFKNPFDAIIYQMGNNRCHLYMYPILFRHPGLVFLHDTNLHHSRAFYFLKTGQLREYFAEMKFCHSTEGEQAAWLIAKGLGGAWLFDRYPLVKLICLAASGIIIHNEYALSVVRDNAPDAEAAIIPAPFEHTVMPDKLTARSELNIAHDEFVIISPGYIASGKGLESSIKACIQFSEICPKWKYFLVGESLSEDYQDQLWKELPPNLRHHVIVTGYVTRKDYWKYISSADVCINLRYPSQGETSSTLLQVMDTAKPVIVPAYRQYLELPKNACVHIELPDEIDSVLVALETLYRDPELSEQIGRKGQEYVQSRHSADRWILQVESAIVAELSRSLKKPSLALSSHLEHIRNLGIAEHIALTLYEWQDMSRCDLVLEPISKAIRELGID